MQRIRDYFGRHPAAIVAMDDWSSAACRRVAPRRPTRGFTLVELLVIITVIVLLLALLLPVLKNAREQAVRVTCTTNLKQRGIAYVAYAVDSNSYLPHVVGETNVGPTSRYDTWYPDGSPPPDRLMSRLLASYTRDNLAVWWCPELWKIRTKLIDNWDALTPGTQAQNSVSAGGFIKLVPYFHPPYDSNDPDSDPGFNAWRYRYSVYSSLAFNHATGQWTNTRIPLFLGTALVHPSPTISADTFGGGNVQTKAPRLSEPLARGTSLTALEMYPKTGFINNHLEGGEYRHQFGTSNAGSNVLRLDGSAKWYTVGSGAEWHDYMREGSSSKQIAVQPFE